MSTQKSDKKNNGTKGSKNKGTKNGNGKRGRPKGTTLMAKVSKQQKGELLADEAAAKVLSRSVNTEIGSVNIGTVMTELNKRGITKVPSDEILQTAATIAKHFVSGTQQIGQLYKMAKSEGYEPLHARYIVTTLMRQYGTALSDRSIRRALPEEAKMASMVRAVEPQPKTSTDADSKTDSKKTPEKDRDSKPAVKPLERVRVYISANMKKVIAENFDKNPKSRLVIEATYDELDKYSAVHVNPARGPQ